VIGVFICANYFSFVTFGKKSRLRQVAPNEFVGLLVDLKLATKDAILSK
jgi:hypothetical protein